MIKSSYPALVGRDSGLLYIKLDHIEFVFDDPQAGESIRVARSLIKVELHKGNVDQFSIQIPNTPSKKIYFEDMDLMRQLGAAGDIRLKALAKKYTVRRSQVLAKIVIPVLTVVLLVIILPVVVSYLPSSVLNKLITRNIEDKIGKLVQFSYEDTSKSQTHMNAEYSLRALASTLKIHNPDLDSFKLEIFIEKNDQVNAYALPGGYIIVQSQLIMQAESVEEILGILAHEFAHIEKRHNIKSMTSGLGFMVGQVFLTLVVGQEASKIVGSTVGLASLKYSRHHEEEADARAFEYLKNAEVSTQGFIDFFQRVSREEGRSNSKLAGVLSTHPVPTDRINKMIQLSKVNQYEAKKDFPVTLGELKVF